MTTTAKVGYISPKSIRNVDLKGYSEMPDGEKLATLTNRATLLQNKTAKLEAMLKSLSLMYLEPTPTDYAAASRE